jgi:hypothetical protein
VRFRAFTKTDVQTITSFLVDSFQVTIIYQTSISTQIEKSPIFQPIKSGMKSGSPNFMIQPLSTSHSLKYEPDNANATKATQSLICPSPALHNEPEAQPPVSDIPIPKIMPPNRLPSQNPAKNRVLPIFHVRPF